MPVFSAGLIMEARQFWWENQVQFTEPCLHWIWIWIRIRIRITAQLDPFRDSFTKNGDRGESGLGVSTSPSKDKGRFLPSARLRELDLMHHWCTKTCHSFKLKHAELFQGYVVKEALKHEYLMESLLALTSLHIASEMTDPLSAAPYVSAALQYQNSAVPAFRAALHNVTPSNCDAVFASSVFMMAATMVSPLLPTGDNDNASSPTQNMLRLFDFVKGITSVVGISHQWLDNGPFGEILSPQIEALSLTGDGISFPIERLRKLNGTFTGTANPLYDTYERVIGQLEKCFAKDKAMAVPFLVLAGKVFMGELRKGEPMALMIFMHWGVILDQLDEMWWAKYSGKRLVEELSGGLLGHGKAGDEATRWARMQVGL